MQEENIYCIYCKNELSKERKSFSHQICEFCEENTSDSWITHYNGILLPNEEALASGFSSIKYIHH